MGILRRLIFAAAVSIAPVLANAACAPDRVDVRGPFGSASFSVELAKTNAEISRGLMMRPSLPRMAGMLFVYDRPKPLAFWMRNTLIPLDMLFIDAQGRVAKIHANAIPLDETPIPSGSAVQFVLEINGGTAAALGIRAGAEVRHPDIAQTTALWPC